MRKIKEVLLKICLFTLVCCVSLYCLSACGFYENMYEVFDASFPYDIQYLPESVITLLKHKNTPLQKPADTLLNSFDYYETTFASVIDSSSYISFENICIKNKTEYDINIKSLLNAKNPVTLSQGGPQVLIIHTHGSESYMPDSNNFYVPTDTYRTQDKNYNVMRVGEALREALEKNNISVIHNADCFDYPNYSGAYGRSLDKITEILEEHPSISVIIDLHRDYLENSNGTPYRLSASINGKKAAQVMLFVGSDSGGLLHKNWEKNLTFAVKLQDYMDKNYAGLARLITLTTGRYNQHISVGSLLVEFGTAANSLDEAIYSAQIFGDVLSNVLKS